jgi:glycine/D-amino acid oxidase-like deaminating enzyme
VPTSSCVKEGVNTTVIIGGGVIGLSTAYWLSRMKPSERDKIIVLEALDQCFLDASGNNSGLISSHWFSGELRKLADHSFNIYQSECSQDRT